MQEEKRNHSEREFRLGTTTEDIRREDYGKFLLHTTLLV